VEPLFHRKDTAEVLKQAEGAGIKSEAAEGAEGVSNYVSRLFGKIKRKGLEQAIGNEGVTSKIMAAPLQAGAKLRAAAPGGLGFGGMQSFIQHIINIDNNLEALAK